MLEEVDWILPTELDTNKNANDHTKKLWEKFAEKDWVDKIEVLTGTSGEILKKMYMVNKITHLYI